MSDQVVIKPLQLVPTEELIAELMARHDHAIFMGVKQPESKPVGPILSIRRWAGNSFVCSGLCASMVKEIMDSYAEREEPADQEET